MDMRELFNGWIKRLIVGRLTLDIGFEPNVRAVSRYRTCVRPLLYCCSIVGLGIVK